MLKSLMGKLRFREPRTQGGKAEDQGDVLAASQAGEGRVNQRGANVAGRGSPSPQRPRGLGPKGLPLATLPSS